MIQKKILKTGYPWRHSGLEGDAYLMPISFPLSWMPFQRLLLYPIVTVVIPYYLRHSFLSYAIKCIFEAGKVLDKVLLGSVYFSVESVMFVWW